MRFRHHVFVCTNRRPAGGRPACGSEVGTALVDALQRAIAARQSLCGRVAVTACACLGPCFDGPNIVVYPDAVWYAGVGLDDVDELVQHHLIGGRALERLRYEWVEP